MWQRDIVGAAYYIMDSFDVLDVPWMMLPMVHQPHLRQPWRLDRYNPLVRSSRDIRYTAGVTYGEMLLQNEYEMSCYNLDAADVATQQQLFQLHQAVRHPAPFSTLVHREACVVSRGATEE